MKCEKCGSKINFAMKYCERCGSKINKQTYEEESKLVKEENKEIKCDNNNENQSIKSVFCTNCGREIDVTDKFCRSCGSKNIENKEIISEVNSETESLSIYIFILLFFALVGGGIFLNGLCIFLAIVPLIVGKIMCPKSKILKGLLIGYGIVLLVLTIYFAIIIITCMNACRNMP